MLLLAARGLDDSTFPYTEHYGSIMVLWKYYGYYTSIIFIGSTSIIEVLPVLWKYYRYDESIIGIMEVLF